MKIISKTITSIFLATIMLTSCNGFTSTPTMNPTDVMETAMSTVKTAVVETQVAIPTTTSSPQLPTPIPPTLIPPLPTPSFSFSVDRHDPESVIRAWFDALVRKDGIAMASVEGQSFANYAFNEPIESIRVLEITPLSSTLPDKRYSVLFDIQMEKGQEGHNLQNGQMLWSFTLTWDVNRDSWFVTNHGFG